ncbi:MAG: 30S ribosome-binding factor RbfA [Planctomycetota bacterium]
MGTKSKRAENILAHEIARIVQQDLNDPRIGFVTITDVVISRDKHYAKVSFSAINPKGAEETDATIALFEKVLNNAAPEVQRTLGKRIAMRCIPKLTFVFTDSIRKSFEISTLIRKARESDLDHQSANGDREK